MKDLLESYDYCPTTSTGKWGGGGGGGGNAPLPTLKSGVASAPFSYPPVDLTLECGDFLIKAWFYSGGRYYLYI